MQYFSFRYTFGCGQRAARNIIFGLNLHCLFFQVHSPLRGHYYYYFFLRCTNSSRLHYCPVDNSTPVVVTIALLGNKTDPPGFYYYNYYYYYIYFFLFRHRSLSFRVSYRFSWETFRGLRYDLRALHNIMYTICILWVCV